MADPAETTQASGAPAGPEELLGAVRMLSEQVGSLRGEVEALRSQRRRGPLPSPDAEPPGWGAAAPRSDLAWLRALERPASRRPVFPRLLLELVFLGAVALAAALAELTWEAVVAVMGGAWALVAAAEWLATRAEPRLDDLPPELLLAAGSVVPEDPSWFEPPAGLAAAAEDGSGEKTAKLPPVPGE